MHELIKPSYQMLASLYSSQFLPIYQPSTLPVKLEG